MTPTPHLSVGLLLTGAAGFTDVVGFIELAGHFTSFMSGNTTQLGLALASLDWSVAAMPASLLALFFVGSVLGSLLALLGGRRWGSMAATTLVVVCVGLTVLLSVVGKGPEYFMLMLAAGAGAQNAILPSTGSVRLGTTFVTGTLYTAGLDLARALQKLAPPWRWAQHLLVWFSLLLGALLGGLAYAQWQIWALLVPFFIYFGFLIAFVVRRPGDVVH